MRRALVGIMVAGLALSLLPTPTTAAGGVSFGATKQRYLPDENVVIRVVNNTERVLRIEDAGKIRDKRTGEVAVRLRRDVVRLRPGAELRWTWDQPGTAGRFVAVVPTSKGRLRDTFDVGQFFTLGFDSHPDTSFVVWVNVQEDVDDMTAEGDRPRQQRQIVSGIVRSKKPYNRPWSYVMGSGSIVLGDAFIEVCDASPQHVEDNLDEWKGERWCPWSSFVESVGR